MEPPWWLWRRPRWWRHRRSNVEGCGGKAASPTGGSRGGIWTGVRGEGGAAAPSGAEERRRSGSASREAEQVARRRSARLASLVIGRGRRARTQEVGTSLPEENARVVSSSPLAWASKQRESLVRPNFHVGLLPGEKAGISARIWAPKLGLRVKTVEVMCESYST